VDVRLKLGNVLRDLGDVEGAGHSRMSRINRTSCLGRSLMHNALSSGKREEAIKIWEAVLAKDPQNRSAGMYLNLVRPQPSKVDRAV
jgi:hypothetical protein